MTAGNEDSARDWVAPGRPGELAVSGPQVAKGYLGDPDQTARRFPVLDHPRLGRSRWYLTGDSAVQDERGLFHHLGRIDNQVKVMGFRVELEEVEAHLRSVCQTESVAAVGWPVVNGNASGIVAFVAGAHAELSAARDALRGRVPAYMVPSKVLALDVMPLSTNGKVDRHALRAILSGHAAGAAAGAAAEPREVRA
jgi:acyl-CoA synthetase (AMP-forming)/AMP-acid ligase II